MKLAPIFSVIALSLATTSISANATPTTSVPTNNQAASQSQQQLAPLTNLQQQNLELLGRVWGFLKYHHPAVASGKYDWDKELIDRLSSYLALDSVDARNQFLVKWIDELGPVELCITCKPTSEDAVLKPDHRWIYQTQLPTSLRGRIEFIYKNRHQGDQHYIVKSSADHPEFTNEIIYEDIKSHDVNHRILTLFRFWNMVEYFFPYKDITDKNWSRVLGEYLPTVYQHEDPLLFQTEIARLISDINDGHAFMGNLIAFHKEKGMNFPRFKMEFVGDKLVLTKFNDNEIIAAPVLEIGDEIIAVNDIPVKKLIERYWPITSAATRQGKLTRIAFEVIRSNDQNAKVTVKRNNKLLEETVQLYSIKESGAFQPPKQQANGYQLLAENIGYINLNQISPEDVETLKQEFQETKGIVIDAREYPRTFVVKTLGGWFVSEKTPIAKLTAFNINNPGEISNLEIDYIEPQEHNYSKPVVVLVNENSMSQPEYTAQAFRAAANVTIMGRPTEGSDGNVTRIILPGKIYTGFSGMGVLYPDGKPTQRIGIVPDIRVDRTIEGIKAGKDEVLDAALKFLTDKHKEKLATAN